MLNDEIKIGNGLSLSFNNGWHARLRQSNGLSERIIHLGPDDAEQLVQHLVQYIARMKARESQKEQAK